MAASRRKILKRPSISQIEQDMENFFLLSWQAELRSYFNNKESIDIAIMRLSEIDEITNKAYTTIINQFERNKDSDTAKLLLTCFIKSYSAIKQVIELIEKFSSKDCNLSTELQKSIINLQTTKRLKNFNEIIKTTKHQKIAKESNRIFIYCVEILHKYENLIEAMQKNPGKKVLSSAMPPPGKEKPTNEFPKEAAILEGISYEVGMRLHNAKAKTINQLAYDEIKIFDETVNNFVKMLETLKNKKTPWIPQSTAKLINYIKAKVLQLKIDYNKHIANEKEKRLKAEQACRELMAEPSTSAAAKSRRKNCNKNRNRNKKRNRKKPQPAKPNAEEIYAKEINNIREFYQKGLNLNELKNCPGAAINQFELAIKYSNKILELEINEKLQLELKTIFANSHIVIAKIILSKIYVYNADRNAAIQHYLKVLETDIPPESLTELPEITQYTIKLKRFESNIEKYKEDIKNFIRIDELLEFAENSSKKELYIISACAYSLAGGYYYYAAENLNPFDAKNDTKYCRQASIIPAIKNYLALYDNAHNSIVKCKHEFERYKKASKNIQAQHELSDGQINLFESKIKYVYNKLSGIVRKFEAHEELKKDPKYLNGNPDNPGPAAIAYRKFKARYQSCKVVDAEKLHAQKIKAEFAELKPKLKSN